VTASAHGLFDRLVALHAIAQALDLVVVTRMLELEQLGADVALDHRTADECVGRRIPGAGDAGGGRADPTAGSEEAGRAGGAPLVHPWASAAEATARAWASSTRAR